LAHGVGNGAYNKAISSMMTVAHVFGSPSSFC